MVPAPGGPVTERPELTEALLAGLTAADISPLAMTVAIEGAGGFGKTTLAAHACRDPRVAERFPGGLLWATVGEQSRDGRLAELIGGLCEALTGHPMHTTEPLAAGGRLGELLDSHQPILLVVDDVWRPDQLAPFMIGGTSARRLITTRNADVAPRGGKTVLVDQMDLEQAAAMLTEGLPELPPELLRRLVSLTGRWPLLLGLVNATIAENVATGAGVREAADWVLRQLAAAGPTAFDRSFGDDRDRSRAVDVTMAASLAMLDPGERLRYFDLAIMPEDADLPAETLYRYWRVAGGLSESAAEKLRARLVRLRLVMQQWTDTGPSVRLHDVLRSYLIHQLSPAELTERHAVMVRAAADMVSATPGGETAETAWWTLPPEPAYLWQYVPYHLGGGGLAADRSALVCDLRWVAAKTARFGTSVPAENDLAEVSGATAGTLRQALGRLSQQLSITEPPTALGATLYAYLSGLPELSEVVSAYRTHLTAPQLVPAWPLPDQPGTGMRRVISGHAYGLSGCAFAPDGTMIATSSHDRTVRVWAVATGVQRLTLTGFTDSALGCAYSPDGALIAGTAQDGTIRIWNAATGHQQHLLAGHHAAVNAGAFAPDGRYLASAGQDGTVRLWDVAAGQSARVLAGHDGPVNGCAFSPDGSLVAGAGQDATVRLWDVAAGQPVRVLAGHDGPVNGCAFSPDGSLVAGAGQDGTVRLWDVDSGTETDVLTGPVEGVTCCAFSPDGTLLAGGSQDGAVRIWYVASGAERSLITGHTEGVTGCAFSPDGNLLASAGHDWHLRLWQVTEEAEEPAATGARRWVYGTAFSADGALLLTSGHDRTARLLDTVSGATVRAFQGHTDTVAGCAISPDDSTVATAGYDGQVRLWDAATGAERAVLSGHADLVYDCAFAPDGSILASVSHDETVHLWTVQTGQLKQVLTGHDGAVAACAFGPGGVVLATASHDQTLRLWDTASGAVRAVLAGHADIVTGCSFSPDGRRLASASHDRTVRVWDVATGRLRQTLTGHSGGVSACAFSPDGTLLVSAGYDRQIRVWDTRTYQQCSALRVAAPLLRVAWHPRQPLLSFTGEAGVYLLRFCASGVREG
jgi:WD40 repeat protein